MKTNKQLAKFLQPHLDKKVTVTYLDGKGAHETTVEQLSKKWFGELISWRERFFTNLLHNGQAHSNFGGTYTMPQFPGFPGRELTDKEEQEFIQHMDNLPDSEEMTRATE